MAQIGNELTSSGYWATRAAGGYEKLGWVKAGGLLDKIVELAHLQGNELVVDVGTGSQAVLDAVAPHLNDGGRVMGFDISADMMRKQEGMLPKNAILFVADTYHIPLPDESVDLVTARMVYHNLDDVGHAVRETARILRPGGKFIISEYVVPDLDVLQFERMVFDIKEKGRHLWTGRQLKEMVACNWDQGNKGHNINLDYATLPKYSVKDWMKKSGLPEETQQAVLQCYLDAPEKIVQKMGIVFTADGDALVDRPFAYVVAEK